MASQRGDFPLFERLPHEIQLMIWEAALENVWVAVCPGKTQFRWNPAMVMSALCRTSREHVKKTHHHILVRSGKFPRRSKRPDEVPTNPDTDTFIIPIQHHTWAPFPRNYHPDQPRETVDYNAKSIQHMRKLILFETTMNHKLSVFGKGLNIRPLLSELNVLPQMPLTPAYPGHQDELISNMRWLERFPNLGDLTYVTRETHYNWWIGGEYRVHGPDVVSRPAEGCKWHGEPEENTKAAWVEKYLQGDPQNQGLEYYEKMGICDDTGTRWAFDAKNSFAKNIWQAAWQRRLGAEPFLNETYAYTDKRRDAMIHKYSDNASAAVPKIGLRGYSYNTSSCGGFWAGYRLYVGNHPRLEFSPLTYDDVKEYLDSFQTYEDNREDAGFVKKKAEPVNKRYKHGKDINPSSPETIVKIAIIRPGEEAPPSHPHHCWEPVVGDFSNCGDLQGVDWRQTFPVNPPPAGKEFKKLMAPGFNRRLSDEDNMLLCSREEKLLKNLNRFRIRQMFHTVMRGIYENHKTRDPAPHHFHEREVPSGSMA